METLKAKAKAIIDDLNENLKDNEWAKKAEKKTGVKPGWLVVGAGFFLAAFSVLVFGQEFFTKATCFFPPAVLSLAKLRSGTIDGPFWITYWLIFNLFNVTESITDDVEEWVPFYHWLKLMFLVWCFHTSTKGSTHIYENIFAKFGDASEVDDAEPMGVPSGGQYVVNEPEDEQPMEQDADEI
mmetsp:Transcript_34558/g.48161  ORF Transcript_34558/g.48161 Transcript_34558/m.48161 type:complete len:183 (+) Transcript_34558:285-833(+)